MGIKYIFSMSEEQKELIQRALFEKIKHNPLAPELYAQFVDAEPCDIDDDCINDMEA